MTIDLDGLPAAVRTRLIRLGQQFGSEDTLDQANQLLKAYADHGARLAKRGFTAADAGRTAEARDMLVAAGVGREAKRGQKVVTSQAYAAAVAAGQTARLSARSILIAVAEDLEEAGALTPAQAVAVALQQTRVASDGAEDLAKQLDALSGALQGKGVAVPAADRGGPEALVQLGEAAAQLRQADQEAAGRRGTPEETQHLDLLDAILVRLARRARKAALAEAKATGDPALASAFKLDKLYQSRAPSPQDGEDHDGEGD